MVPTSSSAAQMSHSTRARLARRGIVIVFATTTACAAPPGADASRSRPDSSRVIPAETPSPPSPLASTPDDTNTIVVYKSASCGCCTKWVEHMQHAGFTVVTHDTEELAAVKDASGVPTELRGCHTAIVGRYVIEGHVPAGDVRRLLRVRPAVTGLAVPGMPAGSPGMESNRAERYEVVTFGGSEPRKVFAAH